MGGRRGRDDGEKPIGGRVGKGCRAGRRHSAGTGGCEYRNSENFGVRIQPADTGERASGIRTAEVRRREDREKGKRGEGGERREEERGEGGERTKGKRGEGGERTEEKRGEGGERTEGKRGRTEEKRGEGGERTEEKRGEGGRGEEERI